MHWLVAQSEGMVSGVSVKLVREQKGSLEKLMVERCWGALGFHLWNSDMSLLVPLTSADGLHSSSSMLYPFHHTRYSSFPWKTQLSRIHSTWSIPSGQGHIPELILTQIAIIIWPNPPHILSHPAVTLQCRHHFRASSTRSSMPSHQQLNQSHLWYNFSIGQVVIMFCLLSQTLSPSMCSGASLQW